MPLTIAVLMIGIMIVLFMDLAALGAVLACILMDWDRNRKSVTHTFD